MNLPQRFTAIISAKHRHHVFSAVSHNIQIAGTRGHMHSFTTNICSGDVVSKDVLKSFCNLLQSEDGTSAKYLVEDLEILCTWKDGNVDLSKSSKNDFSTGFVSDDNDCKYFASKPVALTVTVNRWQKNRHYGHKCVFSGWPEFSIWPPKILVCVSLQKKNLIDTFWRPYFSI